MPAVSIHGCRVAWSSRRALRGFDVAVLAWQGSKGKRSSGSKRGMESPSGRRDAKRQAKAYSPGMYLDGPADPASGRARGKARGGGRGRPASTDLDAGYAPPAKRAGKSSSRGRSRGGSSASKQAAQPVPVYSAVLVRTDSEVRSWAARWLARLRPLYHPALVIFGWSNVIEAWCR